MKRRFLLLGLMSVVLTALAQTVTREEAHQRAVQFLQQQGRFVTLPDEEQHVRSKTPLQEQAEVPVCHVFNLADQQGFVVMAADDCLGREVLAYGEKGEFDMEHLNPGVQEWLDYITRLTVYLREHGLQADAVHKAPRSAVAPIVKTAWGQSAPYNNLIKNGQYLTGCGATAMAQAMSVYRYPTSVQTSIPNYVMETKKEVMSGVAAGTPIDWNNIINDYGTGSTTSAQKKAIAELMLYCGVSVEMDYGEEFSGSTPESLAIALKKYFGYYQGLRINERSEFSNADWDELIYGEIAAGRPVIMAGQTQEESGHIFICDGYNASGLYHINWGWEGYLDAYFALTDLTPPDTPSGYNYYQCCISGIKPDDGTFAEVPVLTTLGMELIDINDINKNDAAPTSQTEYTLPPGYGQYFVAYSATIANKCANTYNFDVNIGVYQDGKLVELLYGENGVWGEPVTIAPNVGGSLRFGYLPPGDPSLYKSFHSAGTYVLKVVSRQSGTKEWIVNDGSSKYCLVCVIDDNKKLTCSIGQSSLPPGPDPDLDPTTVTDAERANLKSAVNQIKTGANAKIQSLATEKQEFSNILKDAQTAKAQCTSIREKLAQLRQRVVDSELSDASKESFLQTIDKEMLENFMDNEKVEPAVDQTIALCQTTIARIDEETASLTAIVAQATEKESQVAAVTDRDAYTQLQGEVNALTSDFSGHQAYNPTADRENALSLLNTAVLNLNNLNDKYLPQLEQQVENAISNIALQQKKDEASAQLEAAREQGNTLLSALENSQNSYNTQVESLTSKRDTYAGLVELAMNAEQQLRKANLTNEQYETLRQQLQEISDKIAAQAPYLNNATEKIRALNMPTNNDMNRLTEVYMQLLDDLRQATSESVLNDIISRIQALAEAIETMHQQVNVCDDALKEVEQVLADMPSCEDVPAAIEELLASIKEAEQQNADKEKELQELTEQTKQTLDGLEKRLETIQAEYSQEQEVEKQIYALLEAKMELYQSLKKQLDDVEVQLLNAELTEERRDSLNKVFQKLSEALEIANQDVSTMQQALSGTTLLSPPSAVNGLSDMFNETVSLFNNATTKEQMEKVASQCVTIQALLEEFEHSLHTDEAEKLKTVKENVEALLSDADELKASIAELAAGIEAAEKLTAEEKEQQQKEEEEKRQLEEARAQANQQLQQVMDASDELTQQINQLKEEAKVLENEEEVKKLLADLKKMEKSLAELNAAIASQKQAIEDATSKLDLEIAETKLKQYGESIANLKPELKKLAEQLQAILTAVKPLALSGKKVIGCYDAKGRPADIRQKGLKILRLSDGTTRKIYVK